MAKTLQYPKLISLRVTEELKRDLQILKGMGVDIGTALREAAGDKIEAIKKELDAKSS